MDLELSDKIAIVTGASRGIGKAIATALAYEGARVLLCARGGEALAKVAAELPRATAVEADVTTADGVARVIAKARELGGVDVLVNNVGGSGARHFDGVDDADFAAALDRNLWPAFRCSRAVLPLFRERRGGVIVNIASIWGKEAGGAPAYNVAKAAEIALTKAMARDVAKDNVRVCSVAPGSIFFPGGGWERRQLADPEGIAAWVKRDFPFGRFGKPEEVANVVAFLASPRASWVSGSCVVVDGGQGISF